MKYKYANHEEIFKQEKERADNFEKLYVDLDQPYKQLKDQSLRLKRQLVEYEQKYGFIDLSRLQEKVRESETEAERSQIKSQMLE